MEIVWDEKTLPAYRDLMRSVKSTQMTMESVVPDTKDDIGRILSVRPEIYLKNKEWRGRGVSVDAEVQLCILYVNEAENAVQSFRGLRVEAHHLVQDSLLRHSYRICGFQGTYSRTIF